MDQGTARRATTGVSGTITRTGRLIEQRCRGRGVDGCLAGGIVRSCRPHGGLYGGRDWPAAASTCNSPTIFVVVISCGGWRPCAWTCAFRWPEERSEPVLGHGCAGPPACPRRSQRRAVTTVGRIRCSVASGAVECRCCGAYRL